MFCFLNHETNKPELLCCKTTQDKDVGKVLEKSDFTTDKQSIFNAAHVIHDDIIQMRTDLWKFEGHLDTTDRDKHIPHTLYSLLRCITQRTAEFGSQYRTDANHKTCLNLSERIMYQVKIQRQVSYIPQNLEPVFRYSTH